MVFLTACGCGSSEKLYPVSGKVYLKNDLLKGGSVSFVPDDAKGNKVKSQPTGMIGPDGSYTLSYEGKPGAPAGWYKVTVSTETPGMGGMGPPPVHTDPSKPAPLAGSGGVKTDPKYRDPSKTDLKVEVVPSPSAGAYDLKLQQ